MALASHAAGWLASCPARRKAPWEEALAVDSGLGRQAEGAGARQRQVKEERGSASDVSHSPRKPTWHLPRFRPLMRCRCTHRTVASARCVRMLFLARLVTIMQVLDRWEIEVRVRVGLALGAARGGCYSAYDAPLCETSVVAVSRGRLRKAAGALHTPAKVPSTNR
jgi:hypothetical protein